jgi:threonine/homoserine/homoserine lactone efflux protein
MVYLIPLGLKLFQMRSKSKQEQSAGTSDDSDQDVEHQGFVNNSTNPSPVSDSDNFESTNVKDEPKSK